MTTRAIGTLGTIDTVTEGGRVFTDVGVSTLITLCAVTTGSNNCTFRKTNGTAAYTPSGSNKFRVLSIRAYANTTGGIILVNIAQSDNDVNFNTGTTALTNPVYLCGSSQGILPCAAPASGGVFTPGEEALNFLLANGKYLSTDSHNVSIFVHGYEEA